MRGGLVGGVCFLAFLLSSGIEGQNLLNSYDLQEGGNTELKFVNAPYEDREDLKVPFQYATDDATVQADEGSQTTGQYKLASTESEEQTFGSSDLMESRTGDQDFLRSAYEPQSEERFGFSPANAFAGSTSRVISENEYIIPDLMLGGENLVVCSRESELHNIWSPVYQCLICVCVRVGWTLQAVCVSCNTCLNPPQPKPPILIIEPPQPLPLPLPPQPPLPIPLPPLPIPLPPPPPLPPQPIPLPPLPIPLPPLPPQPIPLPPLPPQPIPLPPLPPQPIPLPPLPPQPIPLPPLPPQPTPLPPLPPQPIPLPPQPIPLPPQPIPLPPQPIPLPPQPIPLLPQPIPLPPLPLPQPDSQVSCDPLPTDSLFQNPLNPCQICICTRVYNVLGQTDIQIKCQENPQCVPDIFPIPPIPEPPVPVPMPQCEGFPPNVPFPHPLDSCKICKCVVEVAYYTPEQRIICIPNPECEEPVLLPEINSDSYPITQPEPQPMPWPPVVRPSTPPSPLPGPPPHETCKPYPPNTPFQHPWDECQICMCSEIYGKNVVNIEVNCYTKKSCCIEPPIPEPIVIPLPLPHPTNNIIFIEPRCRYQQPQSLFVADCNVCICNVIYTYVVAECTPQPNCGSYPSPIIGGNADASAQAIANAYSQDYSLNNQPGFNGVSNSQNLVGQYPYDVGIPGNVYAPGSLSNQLAQSKATAISQSQNLYPYPNSNLYAPELSQSSAIAQANAESMTTGYPFTDNGLSNAQAQADAIANTQLNNFAPYSQYPYSLADLSSAQAQAEAYANAQYSGFSSPYNTYPYPLEGSSLPQYGSYPYSSNQAEASASAESGGSIQNYLGGNNLISQQLQGNAPFNAQPGIYDGYPSSLGIGNYYNAEAQAQAIANAQSGTLSQYNINPYYLEGSQSDSQAQAEALANSLSGNFYISGPYGYPYPINQVNEQANAIATANSYPSLYTNDNPLNQLGTLWGDNSAQAQGGSASAQSIAQASATSGRPLIRSGKGLCKYNGDKYHHNCQACFCFQDDNGSLYTLCLGNPCA